MADPYWVSPTGEATWGNAQNANPLEGTACASIGTMNSSVGAGDTVNLRNGSYTVGINPADSGTSESRITIQAYTGETPTFSGSIVSITIDGQDYITIDGITANTVSRFFMILDGADYNEIGNCTFDIASEYSCGFIGAWDSPYNNACTHNWIHDNTFTKAGAVSACNDYGTHIRIGYGNVDASNYNTVEDNEFSYGGHDCIDIGGKYNVVRNNIFHNEEVYFEDLSGTCTNTPTSGYFGNRCMLFQWYSGGSVCGNNLVEGNRAGHAGTPPDDDGAFGLAIASAENIVRFNYLYNNGAAGIYFKGSDTDGDYNRVYNNTVYYNGYGDEDISDLYKKGILIWTNRNHNVVVNNIVYNNTTANITDQGTDNDVHDNYELDPTFVNPNISNPTSKVLPDLGLQSGSGAINAGVHLTQANGSGDASITLIVDDATFFQDGTWGSSLSTLNADWIAIGSVGNTVEISSINSNTITLVSPMTWSDDDLIWLYKDSDGCVVLNGSAPNYGAYQGKAMLPFNQSTILRF